MECLVCKSKNITAKPTKISDFLAARIFEGDEASKLHEVNLCHCEDCSFSFYDRRLTDEEAERLYRDYRGEEYQKTREKYDCWYTEKVNRALNSDKLVLSEQKRVITEMINDNVPSEIKVALDYGGNRGETFTEKIGTAEKYVYDISGIQPIDGIKAIRNYSELAEHKFDFIMCNMTLEHVSYPVDFMQLLYDVGDEDTYYYLEVPSENPFEQSKFSISKNIGLLFNKNYNKIRLVKHYFNLRKQPYMPMSEHINFFTPKALETLLKRCGFEVVNIRENFEKNVMGKNKVLSAVFKKSK